MKNYIQLPTRLQVLEFIIPYEFGMIKNAKSNEQLNFLVKAQRQHLKEYKNVTGKNYKNNNN